MKRPSENDFTLVTQLRAMLTGPAFTEQKMFGGVCFMLHGNMVAGTLRNELLVRVGKDGNDAALKRPHAHPMDHMGRPVPGYVMIGAEGTRRDRDLKNWLDLAVAHVSTLPAKTKKSPAKKTATKERTK